MIVDLFIPCFIDQLYPESAFNLIKVLKKLNIDYNYNPKQTCCGQPSFNSGYWKETRKVATKFLNDFPNDRLIVSLSASCSGFVKNYYPLLFEDKESVEYANYKRVNKNMFELTDFLVNKIQKTELGAKFPHKITYHDACSALREYGIKEEPRKLLANVEGVELIEMKENETCCGFGGTFAVKNQPISSAMVQQKVENALDTGAEYIVSTEASCLMNIQGYISKHNLPIKTIHIVDVLASGY